MSNKFIDCSGSNCSGKRETVFTHCYDNNEGWVLTTDTPNKKDIVKIKYLGNCAVDGDMFAVTCDEDQISIYKGVKGDEFD